MLYRAHETTRDVTAQGEATATVGDHGVTPTAWVALQALTVMYPGATLQQFMAAPPQPTPTHPTKVKWCCMPAMAAFIFTAAAP